MEAHKKGWGGQSVCEVEKRSEDGERSRQVQ